MDAIGLPPSTAVRPQINPTRVDLGNKPAEKRSLDAKDPEQEASKIRPEGVGGLVDVAA